MGTIARSPDGGGSGGASGEGGEGGAGGEGGEGGGGEGGAGGEGGEGGGGEGGAGGEGGEGGAGGAGGEGGQQWFETAQMSDEERTYLINNNYHKQETPEGALQLALRDGMAAQKKLGAPADQLIRRPEEGQEAAEWRKANAEAFGVPPTAEAYAEGFELPEAPEGLKWGETIQWDEGRATETYKAMHEMGVPKDVAQGVMGLYAQTMLAEAADIRTEAARLQKELNDKLTESFGGEAQGRLNRAARAMHTVFRDAGVPEESAALLQQKMMREGKVTDFQIVKVFDHIAELIGEDGLADDILNGGGAGPGGVATPAEAQVRIDAIKAKGTGDYAKAQAAGDQKRMAELMKEISQLNGIIAAANERKRA